MAARVNTKFVLILFIVVTAVAGIVAGILLYRVRTDAGRAVQRGDEQMQLGDYHLARQFYGRAVGKDPANSEFIQKLEDALTSIQPRTMDEARELYSAYISLRKHDADYHPLDADKHIAYLDEVRMAARRSNEWWYWELVDEGAEHMWVRLSADPDRVVARLYLGEARTNGRMADRLSEEEVDEGIEYLEDYVEARPADDSGWAALVTALLARAERYRAENQLTKEAPFLRRAEDVLDEARGKAEEGPELLIASLRIGLYRLLLLKEAIDEAAIAREATRLVELVEESADPWLVEEVVKLIDRYRWIEDVPRPIELVDRYLESHPNAHGHRLLQARLHGYNNDLEAAESSTRMIIDADLLHVSYVSQIQFKLKRRAASLNVDIAVRRWEFEDSEGKAARLVDVRSARDALESLVNDPDNDPLLLRANGKIAYAEGRFGEAAAIFDRLATDQASSDFETLMYAAVSLERRGDFGAAIQRLEEALALRPGNNIARLHQADLRIRMGQYEQASELVTLALDLEPENEKAKETRARIEGLLNPEDAIASDPILAGLDTAQTAMRAGEHDSARSTIAALQVGAPDDLRLLNAMITIEMSEGRTDEARRLLARGLELAPGSRAFLTLQSRLENPDPIERIKAFVEEVTEDEVDRTMEMIHSLRLYAIRADARADELERAGSTEEAAEFRELATRARAEVEEYRVIAEDVVPENNGRFIELRFLEGLEKQDWDAVESVIRDAVESDTDLAGGAMYQGRYQMVRGNPREALTAFALVTERVPYSALAWRFLALCHQRLGQGSEALAAYERAYTNNPGDIATILAYGSMLGSTGNSQRAVHVFREGRRLAPSNVELRDAWLNAEREVGNAAVALRERRRMYEEDPSDTRNAAALANLLGTIPPSHDMLLDENGEEIYSAARWARLPEQGENSKEAILAETLAAWHKEADAIVDDIAPPDERDVAWHALRAALLAARGQVDEGLTLLEEFADKQETQSDRFTAFLAVGGYLSRVNRSDDAIEALKAARELQAEGDLRAELGLGDMLFAANRFEEALTSFKVVEVQDPGRKLEMKIAECNIRLGRLSEARELIDALEDDGKEVDAMSLLLRSTLLDREADVLWVAGRKDEAQAKIDEQRDVLRQAEEKAPADPMPHVLQASSLLKAFQRTGEPVGLDEALRILGRADEIRPNFARTSLVKVGILKAQGNDSGAINELIALVEREPTHFRARQLLVPALVSKGRRDDAIAVVEEAVRRDPTLVRWRVVLGDLYNGVLMEARDELIQATPNSRAARTLERRIAELEAKVDGEFSEAIKLVPSEALLIKRTAALLASDHPKYEEVLLLLDNHQARFESSPMLRMLYGKALGKSGFSDRMNEQMRLAYHLQRRLITEGKHEPGAITRWYLGMRDLFGVDGVAEIEKMARELAGDSLDAYEVFALANLWRVQGPDGMSRAIELGKQAIESAPQEDTEFRAQAHSDLGTFYVIVEQYGNARVEFEKVLELDPNNARVLNNLAYLLAEMQDDPEAALPYAHRSAKIRPNDWSVLDTVGWIYFQLKNLDNAEQYLRDSEEVEVTATNQYHLAEVFAAKGDYDRARRRLRAAAELDPDPDTLADINRLADDIRTKR